MAKINRLRETVSEIPSAEEIRRKQEEGWRLAAVEWQREEPTEAVTGAETVAQAQTPYGLTTFDGKTMLLAESHEEEVIRLMFDMVTDDSNSLATVAAELNRRGHRTRHGDHWSASAVFNMLPRLVELGPQLIKAGESPVNSVVVH